MGESLHKVLRFRALRTGSDATGMESIYVNYGGFDILIAPSYPAEYKLEYVKKKSIVNWKYYLFIRRGVRFQGVFKTIVDECGKGVYYVKISFYEIRDKPVELTLAVLSPQVIVLLDSNMGFPSLIKRMLSNPLYGETIALVARVDDSLKEIEHVSKQARFAHKIFLELTPMIHGRGLGRIMLMKLREAGSTMELTICVSREAVSMESTERNIKMRISSLEYCI